MTTSAYQAINNISYQNIKPSVNQTISITNNQYQAIRITRAYCNTSCLLMTACFLLFLDVCAFVCLFVPHQEISDKFAQLCDLEEQLCTRDGLKVSRAEDAEYDGVGGYKSGLPRLTSSEVVVMLLWMLCYPTFSLVFGALF